MTESTNRRRLLIEKEVFSTPNSDDEDVWIINDQETFNNLESQHSNDQLSTRGFNDDVLSWSFYYLETSYPLEDTAFTSQQPGALSSHTDLASSVISQNSQGERIL
jgi:hypothetical protein